MDGGLLLTENILIFQLPVHFLPKVSLRLERLFNNVDQACTSDNPTIHNHALKNVIEIIKIIEKPELKSRFIKELMRIEHLINKSQANIPNELYAHLFVQVQVLNHLAGRFGGQIHQDPFIKSIRFSQSSNDSDCESQSPQLLFWLEKKMSSRQENLVCWLSNLQSLRDTVSIYLAVLRDRIEFEQIDMQNGYYNGSLPAKTNYHMILIEMRNLSNVVPKIQIAHHGLSIRLYDAYSMQEFNEETSSNFNLGVCIL
jgi:cell division protein ZapD